MLTTREALEAALVRSPEDLTLHMAYADHLIESGDSRGDYIRLCLVAEEPSATKKERRQRREIAERVLLKHQHDWLGDLAEFLLIPKESRRHIGSRPRVLLEWKRGWIVGITCYGQNDDLLEALLTHKLMPLLESLAIDANTYRRPDPSRVNWPEDYRDINRDPYYFLRNWPISPLKRLLIQDVHFQDQGVEHVTQGICFPHLQSLSLTHCNITDDGAALLAKHPHTPMIESLRLEQNLISPLGIEQLLESGIRVSDWQRFGQREDL